MCAPRMSLNYRSSGGRGEKDSKVCCNTHSHGCTTDMVLLKDLICIDEWFVGAGKKQHKDDVPCELLGCKKWAPCMCGQFEPLSEDGTAICSACGTNIVKHLRGNLQAWVQAGAEATSILTRCHLRSRQF